uniref:C2H2-type domain-containing protein n=1 Tax=Panagrellus redivivus TaxID=6233 RepID=A0A7E4UMP0_PANRE
MPYRSELKRPDLKGQFPCSVCGKVFCHSSSLSRHRMQAHFKSYQCMQCNQEISSNETLRSHMMRTHQIARMFMCRCCNWAFPDKTSLHLHTTSLSKTGKPGDVAVLARSFAEDDEPFTHMDLHNTPSSSPPDTRDSVSPHEKPVMPPLNNNALNGMPPFPMNPILQALFNQMAMKQSQERKEAKLKEETPSRITTPTDFIAQWVANNPFMSSAAKNVPSNDSFGVEVNNLKRSSPPLENVSPSKLPKSESIHESPVKFNESSASSVIGSTMNTPVKCDSSAERKNKRKSRKPQQLPAIDGVSVPAAAFTESPMVNTDFETKKNSESECGMSEHNQLSPAVSDSHTSGSGNDTNESKPEPPKEVKERLASIEKVSDNLLELCEQERLTSQAVKSIVFQIRELCH